MKRGVNAYANVGLETGVASASPLKLIIMLYDGALAALLGAKVNMAAGNIAAKGSAISKAITIIDNGLRASLDKTAGGEIADNLDALYDYMTRRLLQANLQNDVGIVEEIHRLLADLRSAWVAIGDKAEPPAPVAASAMPRSPTLASA
jgi:flagellar protein FliS